jgi:hypothetical protein
LVYQSSKIGQNSTNTPQTTVSCKHHGRCGYLLSKLYACGYAACSQLPARYLKFISCNLEKSGLLVEITGDVIKIADVGITQFRVVTRILLDQEIPTPLGMAANRPCEHARSYAARSSNQAVFGAASARRKRAANKTVLAHFHEL